MKFPRPFLSRKYPGLCSRVLHAASASKRARWPLSAWKMLAAFILFCIYILASTVSIPPKNNILRTHPKPMQLASQG